MNDDHVRCTVLVLIFLNLCQNGHCRYTSFDLSWDYSTKTQAFEESLCHMMPQDVNKGLA